jgi:hypothetical protein
MVTIELEPADGGTMVRLTHSGLPADARELTTSQRMGTLPRPAGASSDWRRPWSGPLRPLDR